MHDKPRAMRNPHLQRAALTQLHDDPAQVRHNAQHVKHVGVIQAAHDGRLPLHALLDVRRDHRVLGRAPRRAEQRLYCHRPAAGR